MRGRGLGTAGVGRPDIALNPARRCEPHLTCPRYRQDQEAERTRRGIVLAAKPMIELWRILVWEQGDVSGDVPSLA